MEMEDHHHHHHQIHLNQYGITDLRHLIAATANNNGAGRPASAGGPTVPPHHHQLIPSLSPPPPPPQPSSFETLMMIGRPISAVEIVPLGLHQHQHQIFHHEHQGAASAAATTSLSGGGGGGGGGLEADTGVCLAGDGGTGRWPRQETLTLLEIRSRLDSKFKEANQKGPLWDEVSRIMSEEHGYQRSGKKCREKFENLYKYYKKTKEGKAGRQDGKHYRFFRQLEALYGESSNSNNNNNNQVSLVHDSHNYTIMANNNNLPFHAIPSSGHNLSQEGFVNNNNNNSLSLSNNSSEFESSSSDDNESSEKVNNNRRGNRPRARSWKAKIKEFIDSQMRKLMEKQEAWLDKLMKTLDQKEKERGLREEEWRRKEASRIDREHKFWAKERAWIEARDSALMEALKNLTGKEPQVLGSTTNAYKGALHVLPSPELGLNPNYNNHDDDDEDDDDDDDVDDREVHGNANVGKGDRRNSWSEPEISRLIQLRTSTGSRFLQGEFSEEVLWEDIAAKMVCLGFDRSGSMCREKWESINDDFLKKSRKKRKENSSYGNFLINESSTSLYNHHGGFENNCEQVNDGTSSSPSNNNATTHHVVNHDACFPFLMGDQGTETLWENYGLKINKEGQN